MVPKLHLSRVVTVSCRPPEDQVYMRLHKLTLYTLSLKLSPQAVDPWCSNPAYSAHVIKYFRDFQCSGHIFVLFVFVLALTANLVSHLG